MERSRQSATTAIICIATLILCTPAPAKIIYVDDDANGLNNGASWQDAYRHLQDALADANDSAKPVEIHVAQGIYEPDRGLHQTGGDRNATFSLIEGVILRGGYAGIGTPDPNARDIDTYETILSGDLKGDDVLRLRDPVFYLWLRTSARMENSYHVVTSEGANGTGTLDGFTISGGNDNRAESARELFGIGYGGGVFCRDSHSALIRCIFEANSAGSGGAMYNESAEPAVTQCAFIGNSAEEGGAVYNKQGKPAMTACTFSGNCVIYSGGAVYNSGGSPIFSGCVLNDNSTQRSHGGAVANCDQSDTRIVNCLFSQNHSTFGEAVANIESALALENCTFVGNWVHPVFACATWDGQACSAVVTNCIFWDGGREILNNNPGPTIRITYSDIEGGRASVYDSFGGITWAEGNIDADPCFAAPGAWSDPDTAPRWPRRDIWLDGDYHLKSRAGRWDPGAQAWILDNVTSPCIDAGDPNSPVGGEPQPNGGRINMGIYGGTPEASKS